MRIIGSSLDFAHPKPDRTTSDDDNEDADDWVGESVRDYVVYHDFPPWSTGRSERTACRRGSSFASPASLTKTVTISCDRVEMYYSTRSGGDGDVA
jgi:hypothetical protein